jgi:type 1 fimbriae regulatory protein FimB
MTEINSLQNLSREDTLTLIAQLQAQVGGSKPRRGKKAPQILYLSEDELKALFRAIDTEGRRENTRTDPVRDRALFEVALGRGLRASEVGILALQDLRMKDNRLKVTRLKGGRSGEFLITERETRALKPYLKDRGWLQGPLFTSRNRRAISRRRLDELMKFYGSKAGLPKEKQHFHCMRHTCATRLLDHGAKIEEVQDILGHEDIRNTMIYAKITNAKRTETGERLRDSW